MRVTSNTFPNNLTSQLGTLATKLYQLQNQASSGQRIQQPSDDPAAAQRTLDLQTEGRNLDQYQANIGRLQSQATTAYQAIDGLKTISDRAGEIATLADGMKSTADLQSYSDEVSQMIHQAVQLANTKYNGTYLFAGTKSTQAPYVETTNANGQTTAVTYQGNTTAPDVEIDAGVSLSVKNPGENTTGTGAYGLITDSRTGADFINHLISLQNHLQAGDATGVAADRTLLSHDEDNIIMQAGNNGAVQGRLDVASQMINSRGTSVTKLVSKEVDADLSQTMVQFSQTQTAYQAAMQAGSNLMKQSLLDYIR